MPAKGGNMPKGSMRSDRKAIPLNKRLGMKKNNLKKTTALKAAGIIKGDARLKIIEKKRTKLLDARDKLAQMAKSKDAREKLIRLREARAGRQNSLDTSFTRPVGTNITMKKDRNGKISLTTNKAAARAAAASISPSVSLGLAVQRQLGLIGALQSSGGTSAGGGLNASRHVQRKSTLLSQHRQVTRGGSAAGVNKLRNINYKLPLVSSLDNLHLDGYPSDISLTEEYVPTAPPVIRRTIHNDIVPELPPLPDFSYHAQTVDNPLYGSSWPGSSSGPNSLSALESRRKKELAARSEYIDYDDPRISRPSLTTVASPSVQRSIHSYVDLDAVEDTQPLIATLKQPLNAGIRARLDTVPSQSQSHGIFAKTKMKPIVSPGHRIVVSNLHSAVTQEDITELFADIGDLMVARLVRPGTAEVIYKNLADANKAVEVYHNRQLDGQPMKCMLVNKRPVNNPTAPAITKSSSTSSSSSSSTRINSSGAIKKPTTLSKNNKLVPDLSTIHKVLFNRT